MFHIAFEKIHLTSCIRYLILLGTDLVCLWFFHSYLTMIFFIILLCLPLLSGICAFLGLRTLTVSLHGHYSVLPYGTPNIVDIKITNHQFFPLFHLTADISEENSFLNQTRIFTRKHYRPSRIWGIKKCKRLEEHSPIRKRDCILLPRESIMIPYTICHKDCGQVLVHISEVHLTDFFGFVTLKKDVHINNTSLYVPQPNAEDILETSVFQKDFQKKGSDSPELFQIREYIPGDRISHIHWKLSSKCNRLMVKEFESQQGGQISLAIELYNETVNGQNSINLLLDRFYHTILYFLSLHYQITVGFWSVDSNQLCTRMIANENMAEELFQDIVSEKTYHQKHLLEEVLTPEENFVIMNQE